MRPDPAELCRLRLLRRCLGPIPFVENQRIGGDEDGKHRQGDERPGEAELFEVDQRTITDISIT
jgi:hypothetical protein